MLMMDGTVSAVLPVEGRVLSRLTAVLEGLRVRAEGVHRIQRPADLHLPFCALTPGDHTAQVLAAVAGLGPIRVPVRGLSLLGGALLAAGGVVLAVLDPAAGPEAELRDFIAGQAGTDFGILEPTDVRVVRSEWSTDGIVLHDLARVPLPS